MLPYFISYAPIRLHSACIDFLCEGVGEIPFVRSNILFWNALVSLLLIPYHCTPRVMYFRQYLFWLLSVNRAEVKYLGNKTEVGVLFVFWKALGIFGW